MTFDVAIVGGGPAGASCASFCARAGLRVVVLEREIFPREKVCGDCLNPACWGILRRLGLAERVRALPHGRLDTVDRMRFWVAFQIIRPADGTLIVESRQMLAVIQMPAGKPSRLPADWSTRFAHLRGK